MESVLRERGGAEEYIRSQGILTKQMVYNQVSEVFRTNRGVGLESSYGGISSGPGVPILAFCVSIATARTYRCKKKNGEVFAVFCVRTAFFVAEGRGVSMFNLTMHNGANKFKPYDVGGMAGVG